MQNTVVHVVAIGRSTGGAREKNTREKCQQSRQNKNLPPLPLLSSQSGTATGSKRNKFLKMTTENLSCINDTVI